MDFEETLEGLKNIYAFEVGGAGDDYFLKVSSKENYE